ncbi:MAG: hypothetical protein P1P89_02605 [Desulfobacterales bacterium]|nr:hypothetical protein [Desulfobacterales bacterium]
MSAKNNLRMESEATKRSGEVYLCQVDERVSCGACCGLYNVRDLSQGSLEAMLTGRTEEFARMPRTVEAIEAFQKKIEGWTPPKRPFPDFYHCPFLGLIGLNGRRVGCLLHPAAAGNNGIDWRGLSYYGAMACRIYFCPSVRQLPRSYLQIFRLAMDHWYPFGLIVTERRLLAAFFREVEGRIGRPITAADFGKRSESVELLREFAGLKRGWPFRRKDAPGPCNYFFENGEYPRPPVQRWGKNVPLSRYEEIFKELESAFSSKKDLRAAEDLLDNLFSRLQAAIPKHIKNKNSF